MWSISAFDFDFFLLWSDLVLFDPPLLTHNTQVNKINFDDHRTSKNKKERRAKAFALDGPVEERSSQLGEAWVEGEATKN